MAAIGGASLGTLTGYQIMDQATGETKTLTELFEGSGGGGGSVAWADVTGKPAVIAAGADQATARSAIGAGTSDLVIGTTGTTAMAGNKVPTTTQRGGVLQGDFPNITADPTMADFNNLLAAIRATGLFAPGA